MNKRPLTMKQKYKLFNTCQIIGYILMIFGIMIAGIASPLLWLGFAIFVALSVYRAIAIRCPECDTFIPSNFGILTKRCPKFGWHVDKEPSAQEPQN